MAIAKMQFVNILGRCEDFDYITQKYIRNIEIQLESATAELHNMHKVAPMDCANPYIDILSSADKILGTLPPGNTDTDAVRAREILSDAESFVTSLEEKRTALLKQEEHQSELLNAVSPFADIDIDISAVKKMKFVHFRFGKMPKDFASINKVLQPSDEKNENGTFSHYFLRHAKTGEIIAVFVPSCCDREYIWGIYFTSLSHKGDVNGVFSSLHFERMFINDEIDGHSDEQRGSLLSEIAKLSDSIDALEHEKEAYFKENGKMISDAYTSLAELSAYYNIRKYAATSTDIFFLVGWMKEEDARRFYKMTEHDNRCTVIIEDENASRSSTPPTSLKNRGLFKPFEMYLGLYGLPSYGEMDPTCFMTISYALLFGIMFGDVGHGLLLLLGGFALYKTKKMPLAGIISFCGVFSTIFGFMFGSIFGNEELLPVLWLRPSKDIMTILITTVALGAVIILIVMLFNIFVKLRRGNAPEAIFSQSGLAGFLFYLTVILTVVSLVTGKWLPTAVPAVIMPLTLLMIFFKEPITAALAGEKDIFGGSFGMFVTQSFFELFEIVLSYLTNTVSFVRVGAFALSHAGMMTVVGILMNMVGHGSAGYYVVFILGNLVVIGLEGLIVSIQVLRLEFYEMFSRFFDGNGHAFKPFMPKKTTV